MIRVKQVVCTIVMQSLVAAMYHAYVYAFCFNTQHHYRRDERCVMYVAMTAVTLDGGNIFSPLLPSRPSLYELVIYYIVIMRHMTYWDRQAKSNEQTAYFSDFMPKTIFSCCAGLSITTILSLDSTDSFFFFFNDTESCKVTKTGL